MITDLYLDHCIEDKERNNDNEKRGRGHHNHNQGCHDGEECENEGA